MAMMTPRTVAIASSPGRAAEKLPAPPGLARLFVRKSKSRAGARASPMFGVRSRSVGPTGRSEGEEPSSPKVTCIGQVRIKAGKKNINKNSKSKKPKSNPAVVKCRCLHRALFCCTTVSSKKKKKKKRGNVLWPCWSMSCCHKGWCHCGKGKEVNKGRGGGENGAESAAAGKGKVEEPYRLSNFAPEPGRYSNYCEEPARSSSYARRLVSGLGEASDRDEEEEDEKEEREDEKVYNVSSAATTPPKNALLLMRCRSAPQHHNRFAPSPLTTALEETMAVVRENGEEEKAIGVIIEKKLETEDEKRIQSPRGGNPAANQEKDNNNNTNEEEQEEEEEEEEEEEMRCSSARPLVLTRCKSEPASKGETIMAAAAAEGGPDDTAATSCFWAHTGSGSRQRKMVPGIHVQQHDQIRRTPSPLPSH